MAVRACGVISDAGVRGMVTGMVTGMVMGMVTGMVRGAPSRAPEPSAPKSPQVWRVKSRLVTKASYLDLRLMRA